MKEKIELLESGLQCDNPKCDWVDKTIKHTGYQEYVNTACPKCGENILTEEDYNKAVIFHSAIDFVNNMSEENIEAFKLDGLDLSPIFSAEDEEQLKNNPDKKYTVDVNLHEGIKFNIRK